MAKKNTIRRCARFSLRTLLIVMTVFAAWLGWQMHRRREQLRVAAAVSSLGGQSSFLLRDLSLLSRLQAPFTLPNDFWFNNAPIKDRDMQLLKAAPQCFGLHLADNEISDKGLAELEGRTDLLILDLTNNPGITNEGLAHLRRLSNLRQLMLRKNSQITDEGLVHLENMKDLDLLILFGTRVTPAGVSELKKKLPKTRIGF
jgi:hypothetical protein